MPTSRFKQLEREVYEMVDKVKMADGEKTDEVEMELDRLEKEIEEFAGRLLVGEKARKLKDLLDTVK